jgi:S1-C subfamily serine protease
MAVPEQSPLPSGGAPSGGVLRRPVFAGLLVVVLAALAGAAIAHFAWPAGPSSTRSVASGGGRVFNPFRSGDGDARVTPSGSAAAASTSTASIAARVDPGVVDINTVTANGAAAGTGMVVTSSGEVITNNHVIDGATRITATDVGNGRTYTARVLGYDRSHDVAVLALNGASGLTTVPLGDSSTVQVGAAVVTVGNAGGVGGTPSAAGGSVAALRQAITAGDSFGGSFERLTGLIRVSGQLQPGDSGGPLVDSAGNVIGMDTAASSGVDFQSASTDGFAIPINEVLAISKKIVAGQASNSIHIGASALLGVYIGSSSAFNGGGSGAPGALVEEVIPGSPAEGAGLAAGDTITALNGHSVKSPSGLSTLMARHHPGERVRLTWLDSSGGSHTAALRLAAGPPA